MNSLKVVISLIAFLCISLISAAQTQVPGISNNIWAIFQDSKGNHWFGSNSEGLFQFNGEVIYQFTTEDGLIGNQIRGIQEDQEGNILIETSSGVSLYDGQSFKSLKAISAGSEKWKLKESDLWFSCNGMAEDVYRYDGERLFQLMLPQFDIAGKLDVDTSNSFFNAYSPYQIEKDNFGNIWFGTAMAAAIRFDGENFLWIDSKELTGLGDGRAPGVRSIIHDQDGYIWLSNFMYKYEITETSYSKIENEKILFQLPEDIYPYFNSGLIDPEGNLWFATYQEGVWKFDGENLHQIPINNKTGSTRVYTIYLDNDGKIWLGTESDGVFVFDGERFDLVLW